MLIVLSLAGACSSQPSSPPAPATPPVASVPRGDGAAPPQERTAPRAVEPRSGVQPEAAWTVDLERDEQRGGHTLARHVGRTDAQLKARLARESISAASTYFDRETAERIIARALADNEARVRRWIDKRGARSNLAIRYRARDGLPTGRVLRRGAEASEATEGAVVVLRWRGEDWYVLTSYPEDVR
ncbi:lipoprotein [Luteitalea sp. TBR-22]|nr:lipoprotein [Luteitalea sp. TBR-22]